MDKSNLNIIFNLADTISEGLDVNEINEDLLYENNPLSILVMKLVSLTNADRELEYDFISEQLDNILTEDQFNNIFIPTVSKYTKENLSSIDVNLLLKYSKYGR
jgi:hypothetical protein